MDSTKTQSKDSSSCDRWLSLVFLALIIGFVPLIMYVRLITLDGITQQLHGGRELTIDVFSFYKALWLYIFTGTALLLFLVRGSMVQSWYYKPMAAFSFFAVVSTVFSRHWKIAVWGYVDRSEGLVTNICYMILVFLMINTIKRARDFKFLIVVLMISASLAGTLGLLQFFGRDFFRTEWGHYLTVPDRVKDSVPDFELSFRVGAGNIYGTFFNSNFVGSYTSMIYLLTLAIILASGSWFRFLLVPLNIVTFMNLIGSMSRAGMLGAGLGFFFLIFFLRKRILCNWRILGILFLTTAVSAFVMDYYTMKHDLGRLFNFFLTKPVHLAPERLGGFVDLRLDGDTAYVEFEDTTMKIKFLDDGIAFFNQNDEEIPYELSVPVPPEARGSDKSSTGGAVESETEKTSPEAAEPAPSLAPGMIQNGFAPTTSTGESLDHTSHGAIVSEVVSDATVTAPQELDVIFPPQHFRGFRVRTWPGRNLLWIYRSDIDFYLIYTTGFKIVGHDGKPHDIKPVESIGFRDREQFASGRGYIWSRSLPLIKKTWLIGFGPDTYPAHFPNHDYVGKLKLSTTGIGLIVDKPHNMYIQNGVNTGLASLVALLAMFAVYLFDSAKIYWSADYSNYGQAAGVGVFLSIIGYLATAVFNDSVISVAPVFWGLLGMGIAINNITRASSPGDTAGQIGKKDFVPEAVKSEPVQLSEEEPVRAAD